MRRDAPGSMEDAKSGWLSPGPLDAVLTLISTCPHSSVGGSGVDLTSNASAGLVIDGCLYITLKALILGS